MFINPEIKKKLRYPMKRVTIHSLINIGSLITFIPSLISGLVLSKIVPTFGIKGWYAIHDYTSLAFAALLIIHMFLHWKSLRNIHKRLKANAKGPDTKGPRAKESDNWLM